MDSKATYLHDHNSQIYESFRNCYANFYPSEQFAIDHAVSDGNSILDIGCNTGGLFTALKERHSGLRVVGLDPDPRCITIAAQRHPDAELIEDTFPSALLAGRSFSTVFCLSLFTHFADWKAKLGQMAAHAETIVVDVALTHGATVDDADVSYTYYLGSGQRVPYVIINMHQFVNYCFTEFVGAADVEVVGVSPPSTTGMPGTDKSALVRGVALIRVDMTGKPFFAGQQPALNPDFVGSIDTEAYRQPSARATIDGVTRVLY